MERTVFGQASSGGSTSERMSDENDNGRPGTPGGRAPITLKPRQGSVSAGVVKQSFSHGRTKTVVVETKRTRPHAAPAGNLAAPIT